LITTRGQPTARAISPGDHASVMGGDNVRF
jgi:hypothetical protein